MTTDRANSTRKAGLSLERKLPLLITTLLVTTLAVGGISAYLEVRTASVESARQRLRLLVERVVDLSNPAVQQRMEALAVVASDSAVISFLESPSAAGEAAALARLEEVSGQMTEVVVLRAADRTPLLHWVAATDSLILGAAAPADLGVLPDSGGYGPFFALGGRGFYWLSVPVAVDTSIVGALAGPTAAGFYHIAKRLGRVIVQCGVQVQAVLYPDVARLWVAHANTQG